VERPGKGLSAHAAPATLASLAHLGTAYWLRVRRMVGGELRRWDALAREIPDPLLRREALGKLSGERLNPEAAALFAVLAPPAERARLVSLIVAYQVLYDYLDGVNEQPGFDRLIDGLQLHEALNDALLLDRSPRDYYLRHPGVDDGGYTSALVAWCRTAVAGVPSIVRASRVIEQATVRCGEAQSHNHAGGASDDGALRGWCAQQYSRCGGYRWWEVAAGGISCLNIHATLACAADPRANAQDLADVEAAYFPSICALSALLDSLADYHLDARSGNHSFVARYTGPEQASERMTAIAREARERVSELRHSPRHEVILAGIVAYYLSSPSVREGFPAPTARELLEEMGPLGASMCGVLKLRRRTHERALQAARPRPRKAASGGARGAISPAE